ncbi:MAG TPA: nucleotidyltransferase domain-containing protein [Iamia sp.]|jgi:predicted nucleotidyltransferase|nr:nucleotidyltransferase domain-containing protein [Iamia sp.]
MVVAARPALSSDEIVSTIADAVARERRIDACVLYGSVARRTHRQGSDIDLLVVSSDRDAANRLLSHLWILDAEVASRCSASTETMAGLERRRRREPAFMAHLAYEGVSVTPLSGDVLRALRRRDFTLDEILGEIERRHRRVAPTIDPARLNGSFVPALSRIYSCAKAVAMARLVAVGTPDFDWASTFISVGRAQPGLATSARNLARLRPFYLRMRGHEVALPRVGPADLAGAASDLAVLAGAPSR